MSAPHIAHFAYLRDIAIMTTMMAFAPRALTAQNARHRSHRQSHIITGGNSGIGF